MLGLQRAFLRAGAGTVVMSMWPVDDRDTVQFMRAFYTSYLERGATVAASLRAAQLELRGALERERPEGGAAAWAAFVAVGDWR